MIFCSHDSLSTALLISRGTDGRHFGLRLQLFSSSSLQSLLMTSLMFVAHHTFHLPSHSNTVLQGGCLFRQNVVDQFFKVASERLEYIQNRQGSLRAANFRSHCGQLGKSGALETKLLLSDQIVRTLFVQQTLPATATCKKKYARNQLHFQRSRLSQCFSDTDVQFSVT